MTQREQFEAWCIAKGVTGNQAFKNFTWQLWQAAQAAKDAEIAELREKLAKCRAMFEFEAEEGISHFVAMECDEKHEELRQAAKEACGL